ncbi:MAG: YbjN domain-containing protein [Gemmobacter sp.]|uniref:YbjN domain-containing protein n=1 Tax=Gemmobacter sp. TaxID=1898957 RepID=UPI003918BDC0
MLADDAHPIDVVETLAAYHAWDFDRVTDDQIAMAVEGQWRTYSLTLAWSGRDETLRLICTFEMEPPNDREAGLYALLNRINDECWAGSFTWWAEQRLMVWRYGLVLAGGQGASMEQVDRMIQTALAAAERFYPAFQLVSWGGQSPEDAMRVAMTEAWGRA